MRVRYGFDKTTSRPMSTASFLYTPYHTDDDSRRILHPLEMLQILGDCSKVVGYPFVHQQCPVLIHCGHLEELLVQVYPKNVFCSSLTFLIFLAGGFAATTACALDCPFTEMLFLWLICSFASPAFFSFLAGDVPGSPALCRVPSKLPCLCRTYGYVTWFLIQNMTRTPS